MFDAEFYRTALPTRVQSECSGHPDKVPVVQLQLADGRSLDLCHIDRLADTWMSVRNFRDAESCDDMDLTFLRYELVTLVAVSLHHANKRRLGFAFGPSNQASPQGVASQARHTL